jgi:hypothetical protein
MVSAMFGLIENDFYFDLFGLFLIRSSLVSCADNYESWGSHM